MSNPINSSQKRKPLFDLKKRTKNPLRKLDILVLLGTFALMFSAIFLVYKYQDRFQKIHLDRMKTFWGPSLMNVTMVLFAIQIAFLLYVLYLYIRYKPVTSVSDEDLPTCTIIVPAYNEGQLVHQTLLSIANSDYPVEKLEIIAVDDGSKDDTWNWMLKAKEELGSRVTIHKQPENKGKRHALYYGFNKGKGEIFITIDSDSIVERDTLRNMASPFVNNEKCGAVAGNVKVLNNQSAMIPRMLNVSFVFSFEFIRSAQSALGSVLCTPGALAAYKREAVLNCLPQWINQTFMGKPSDIGEDRAMTNMILKQGYHVLFQKNAYVLTNTPEQFKGLYKMFIRWERSNVRENIMMSKFAFKNFREGSKIGARVFLLNQWLKVIMAYPVLLLMLLFIIANPIMFVCTVLISVFVFSSVQVLFYNKSQRSILDSIWAYPYSIFYTFTLFWITPYAIATASRRGWLTR